MKDFFLHAWWVLALRGILGILFGVLAILRPEITLAALIVLFAAYALLNGIVSVIGAIQYRQDDNWWFQLLIGLISLGAGIITMAQPVLTALVLVLVIAAYALMTGVLDIVAAIRLRETIQGEWLLALNGILSIAFGTIVLSLIMHRPGRSHSNSASASSTPRAITRGCKPKR